MGCPHLVLPDTCRVVGIRSGDLPNPFDHMLGRETAIFRLVVPGRIAPLEILQVAAPLVDRGAAFGWPEQADQLGDHLLAVADDGHIGDAVLGDLGWIDVSVDHLRQWGEVESWPVTRSSKRVPSAISRSLRCGPDSGDGAMHSRHAHVLWVSGNTRAPSRW